MNNREPEILSGERMRIDLLAIAPTLRGIQLKVASDEARINRAAPAIC